jgi:hypothetical protein
VWLNRERRIDDSDFFCVLPDRTVLLAPAIVAELNPRRQNSVGKIRLSRKACFIELALWV